MVTRSSNGRRTRAQLTPGRPAAWDRSCEALFAPGAIGRDNDAHGEGWLSDLSLKELS